MLTVRNISKNKKYAPDSIAPVFISILFLGLLLVLADPSGAVHLDIGDGSGTVGDTVTVGITTTDLTGLDVFSFELRVTWTSTRASVIDVLEMGTLTSLWGPVTFNSGSGEVRVAAAGEAALSGSGTLVNLQFVLGPSNGNTTLYFSDFVFNEGVPGDTLTNGSLNVSPLPTITIGPNSGEILVGDSLLFYTSGGTPPYTYFSSDPVTADFGGNAYLKGFAPGSVIASVMDDNGLLDETNDQIYVRAVRLTAGTGTGMPRDTVIVPIAITDAAPFDIRSAEFSISYSENQITALTTIDTGTVAEAAGWLPSTFRVTSGKVQISMAGALSLGGPGTLVYLKFAIDPVTSGGTSVLTVMSGLFNEIYPAMHASGSIVISVLPTLTVSPNTSNIVAGDELQFSVSGSTSSPFLWGVTNPAVASIDNGGKLSALQAGSTRVFVVDNIGATDTTDTISICDLYVIAPEDTIWYSYPSQVPIYFDRNITEYGIYGWELVLQYDPSKVKIAGITANGTASSAWGAPTANNNTPGTLVIIHAGSTPLSGNLPLIIVNFEGLMPGVGTTSNLAVTKILFNEGDPCAMFMNGSLYVPTGVHGDAAPRLHLEQNVPNPFQSVTTIPFALARSSNIRLNVYSATGAMVKSIVEGYMEAGIWNFSEWDGTNEWGERVSSGVYFYRLQVDDAQLTKKAVLIK